MKFFLVLAILMFSHVSFSENTTGIKNNSNEVEENLKKENCKVIGINATTAIGSSSSSTTSTPKVIKN